MKNRLTSLIAASSLFLAGCEPSQTYHKVPINSLLSLSTNNISNSNLIEVEGTPLSVSIGVEGAHGANSYLSLTMTDHERVILGYAGCIGGEKASKAAALIQSGINSHDNESMLVRGEYDASSMILNLKSITLKGYTIQLEN